jgi:two-component system KDP operon response regulator KdpE
VSARIRALVVDDEDAILRFLKPALEANNYEMTSTGTVTDAVKRVAAETPDIVLLDLGLPDGDGKDVIRRCREWSDVPIIVLSARDREVEKIEALDLGADDYVNKPFNVGELLARMRTALRHRMQRKAEIPVLRVGGLEIDAVRHRATRAGAELKLTPKEFELLSFLAKHAGRVITHKQILASISASCGRRSKNIPTIRGSSLLSRASDIELPKAEQVSHWPRRRPMQSRRCVCSDRTRRATHPA